MFLAVGLALLAGCPTGDYCSRALDKQLQCASPEQRVLLEGRFESERKECRERKARDQEEEKAELACVEKSSCEEYTACMNKLSESRHTGKVRQQIAAAVQSGEKIDEALQACRLGKAEDAEIQRLCGGLYARALDTATVYLQAQRDRGEVTEGKCADVLLMAEKVSPEAKTKMSGLCDEVEASRGAHAAIAAAREHIDARTLEVPYQCNLAVESLEKIGNDWARGKLAEVTKTCYVELGAAILPDKVPGMQTACDHQVDQVYKVVKKYNLKDPGIDPWIDKATAKCSGATASAG